MGTPVYANGFKVLGVKSAKATAMGEAFVAQADDPSAIAFNPAGLPAVKGTQASLQLTETTAWIEHTAPSGRTEKNIDSWQTVPAFYLTSDWGWDAVTTGFGISVPNGLGSEWSKTSMVRYVATYSDLQLIDFNPCVGWAVNDRFSVGLGISYYKSEATLENMLDFGLFAGAPGAADALSRLRADGDAWGYNAGVQYQLSETSTLALTFKSPFTVDYSGNADLGPTISSPATASLDYAGVVVFGYAFKPSEKLKCEVNIDWTNGNRLNNLVVDFSDPALADAVYQYNLENTFAYKFGVEYQLNERLALRAGYIYNENATPEATFRPSLPDTETHFLCTGVGYTVGKFVVDAAAVAIFYEDRTIDNNVGNNEFISSSSVDGRYETFAVDVAVGVTYRF
ncbi:MAG: outer membrane protein transport protein [Candidatus Omnitrophica bacterium]|nr:outer membrane protein transport protein [Candidatus Omnitrophota bacterium]